MMMIPKDLTPLDPQELYNLIQVLHTYRITDGKGRTAEAAHVRDYVQEEKSRVKIELTRRGLPRVEPGRERTYGPGQAAWQKDKAERPRWALVESLAGVETHLIPHRIWNRPKIEMAAVCGFQPHHRYPWIQTDKPNHELCRKCVHLTGYQEEPEPDPAPDRECPLKCNQGLIGRSPEGELVFCSCGPGRRAEIAWWEDYLVKLEAAKSPAYKSEIFVVKHWIVELAAQLHRRESGWADDPDHPFEGAVQAREDWVQEAIAQIEEDHKPTK